MNPRNPVSRREFVKTTATAVVVAASGFAASQPSSAAPAATAKSSPAPHDLIDTNVTLGRWPFRRVPLDETAALVAKLRQHGVTQAWAGNLDGLFHKDIAAVNARLADECRQHGRGLLVPFGSINLKLPDWEDDLRRCAKIHQMTGIRLHPSYHGYKFDEPAFAKLLSLAHEHRLIVQIVADMEDERTQHPLARAPHADFQPLPALLQARPGLRIVCLNSARSISAPIMKQLAANGACFDIATLENVGGVANLIQQISVERVVFGSNAPLFYFESATLKLKESALAPAQERAVCHANAQHLC